MVFLAKPPKSFAIWYGLAICELEEPGIMGPMTLLRILTATSNTHLLKRYLFIIEKCQLSHSSVQNGDERHAFSIFLILLF